MKRINGMDFIVNDTVCQCEDIIEVTPFDTERVEVTIVATISKKDYDYMMEDVSL